MAKLIIHQTVNLPNLSQLLIYWFTRLIYQTVNLPNAVINFHQNLAGVFNGLIHFNQMGYPFFILPLVHPPLGQSTGDMFILDLGAANAANLRWVVKHINLLPYRKYNHCS